MSARTQTQRLRRASLCALAAALAPSPAPPARAATPTPPVSPPPLVSPRQIVPARPPAPTQSPAAARQPRGGDATEVARLVALVRDAQSADDAALERARTAGYELLGAGRFADAERVFAALLEKWPRDRDALYGAALSLFNLRRAAEAEPLARAAVAESQAALKPYEEHGRSGVHGLKQLGKAQLAAADAHVLFGYVLAARGDGAGSLAAVREAVRLAPYHFDAQFALGRALYGAGDATAAAAAFGEAVRLRPADAQARFFHATALERANEPAAAERAYRELVARSPRDARGHLGLGVLLTKAGGEAAAEGVASLLRAVALDPDSYEARAALGRALVRANRHAEAVEHLVRAAALAPDNPEPQFQLAIAYRRLGRAEDAARASAAVRRIHERRRGVNVNNNNNDRPDDKPDE